MEKTFGQRASSHSLLVYRNTSMLHDQISLTEIRPPRRIDDIALKRCALFGGVVSAVAVPPFLQSWR
jgi:hypothetical protein